MQKLEWFKLKYFRRIFRGSNPDWETTFMDWKFSTNSSFLFLFDTNLKYMCYNEFKEKELWNLKINWKQKTLS